MGGWVAQGFMNGEGGGGGVRICITFEISAGRWDIAVAKKKDLCDLKDKHIYIIAHKIKSPPPDKAGGEFRSVPPSRR